MTPIEKRIVQGLIDLDKYKDDYIGSLIRGDSDEEFERISKKYVVAKDTLDIWIKCWRVFKK